MTGLLAYVLEGDELGTPALTSLLSGLPYLGLQFGIEDEIHIRVGVTLHQIACQVAHSRTEGEEILGGVALVLHLSQGYIGPRVVCAAEDKDDVGATQLAGACDEGAVGEVLAAIAGVADSGSAVGIVGIELEPTLLAEQVPPGLCDIGHICPLGLIRLVVPHRIAGRDVALVCAVGGAQH